MNTLASLPTLLGAPGALPASAPTPRSDSFALRLAALLGGSALDAPALLSNPLSAASDAPSEVIYSASINHVTTTKTPAAPTGTPSQPAATPLTTSLAGPQTPPAGAVTLTPRADTTLPPIPGAAAAGPPAARAGTDKQPPTDGPLQTASPQPIGARPRSTGTGHLTPASSAVTVASGDLGQAAAALTPPGALLAPAPPSGVATAPAPRAGVAPERRPGHHHPSPAAGRAAHGARPRRDTRRTTAQGESPAPELSAQDTPQPEAQLTPQLAPSPDAQAPQPAVSRTAVDAVDAVDAVSGLQRASLAPDVAPVFRSQGARLQVILHNAEAPTLRAGIRLEAQQLSLSLDSEHAELVRPRVGELRVALQQHGVRLGEVAVATPPQPGAEQRSEDERRRRRQHHEGKDHQPPERPADAPLLSTRM